MMKIKLSAGSKYIRDDEAQAIKNLERLLSKEDGYIIPILFIGKQIVNREIDAVLLLPDAIFLIDFKNWDGDRIEVEGINGRVRRFINGAWEEGDNSLPDYEYAARVLAPRLKRERGWLPNPPRIYSVMVFTSIGFATSPQVSFAGGDPHKPMPKDGVGACRIEQFPRLLSAFRLASQAAVSLNALEQSHLAHVLLEDIKSPAKPVQRRIEGYVTVAEHHTDTFLNCKIYLGEGELFKEQVWIKEYEQVFASPKQHNERERLILRHADILHRFPQHKNIVNYCVAKSTERHLYIILSRKPGAFLSELLTRKSLGTTVEADVQRIPFDLNTRLQILGGLLEALEYLTQQPGFEQSAYRDLRPDSIFVQFTGSTPIAQLFNFDCTKLPGAVTRLSHLKAGQKRAPLWDDYASPELLDYIESGRNTSGTPASFMGDVSSDVFSWAIIAWELLSGELPFPDTAAKLAGRRNPWPPRLARQMLVASRTSLPEAIRLIEACLDISPARRPSLKTLRGHFP